ncbi:MULTISPECIES: dihydroxyacetone kinase phosphoryl donor subunit DhaM [Cetobacterium]|uniref:dihydroxyacetone kinase phosphoryl donor subunit DhaM n=2 Tax=Fusobacteriaceae TaxID=203492 RepID=UPI001F063FD4|nr:MULTISPECIES: dihydroxyacetone kinase phosphoryl donor subunit DhaM [Cetobacterium]MCX3066646.1 dihydroxyacetone kinase phosphoryl donor subunit DhaM [Cetobacterium somerae]UPO98710.1 dihydroxyacetone kinase phosphoryl donor subunit DhaM [Cetobacterium somerae]
MLGFVVVSHSKRLADEVIELCNEMKKYNFPVVNGSGTDEDYLGSNPLIIAEAIKKAYIKGGVAIFGDLGSSILNAELALEFLDEDYDKEKIKIMDAPLVEGVLMGMAINDEKLTLKELEAELKELKFLSKI